MAVTTLGLRNRNVSSVSTFMDRYLTYYIKNPGIVANSTVNGAIIRFSDPDEALIVLGCQASAAMIAGGITTFQFNLFNSTASMLTTPGVLKGHANEIVNGIIHPTNNLLAAGEVAYFLLQNSGNENAFDVAIKIKVRPYVGRETRTL